MGRQLIGSRKPINKMKLVDTAVSRSRVGVCHSPATRGAWSSAILTRFRTSPTGAWRQPDGRSRSSSDRAAHL